jgi:hypothetical protein
MNVTGTQITETQYSFRLTQAELDRYLADPAAWAADTRAQIGAAVLAPALTPAPARGAHKTGRTPRPVVNRPGKKSAAKNAPSPRQGAKGNSLEPLQCPHCPNKIVRKYFARHIALKHPTASQSDSASQAPAPAAASSQI